MKKTLRYFSFALALGLVGLAFQQCAEPQEQIAPAEIQKKNAAQELSPYVSIEGIQYKLNISEQDAAALGVEGKEFQVFAQELISINEAAAKQLAEDPDADIVLCTPGSLKEKKWNLNDSRAIIPEDNFYGGVPFSDTILLPYIGAFTSDHYRETSKLNIKMAPFWYYTRTNAPYYRDYKINVKIGMLLRDGSMPYIFNRTYYTQPDYYSPDGDFRYYYILDIDINMRELFSSMTPYLNDLKNRPWINVTGGGEYLGLYEDRPCAKPSECNYNCSGSNCPYYNYNTRWIEAGKFSMGYFEITTSN